jgi:hypothetical protein
METVVLLLRACSFRENLFTEQLPAITKQRMFLLAIVA